MDVKDQNVQTNTLEMKDQNKQTGIVQIKDQQMQEECTTQQQGIKTTSVAVFIACTQYFRYALIHEVFFEEQESMTCTNATLL